MVKRGQRAIQSGTARFFVGMKELTGMSTEGLSELIRRWPELDLPSKATLNMICRKYGLAAAPPESRTQRVRELGHLKMTVFGGWFVGDEKYWELAMAYDTWSGAIVVKLGQSFEALEEIEAFLRTALNAFPPEYRRQFHTFTLLQRKTEGNSHLQFKISMRHSAKMSCERFDMPIDVDNLGCHDPRFIGRFMLFRGFEDRRAFSHFIARLVADYNCFGASDDVRKLRSAGRRLRGFSGWDNDSGRIGGCADVDIATKDKKPATRIFVALSSLKKKTGGAERGKKYILGDIVKYLSPDTPRPRSIRSRKVVQLDAGRDSRIRVTIFPSGSKKHPLAD